MSSEATDELVGQSYTVQIRLTRRRPDMLIAGITITPRAVQLTYHWPTGATVIEIRGQRKGGGWSTLRMLPEDRQPPWLLEKVDEHRPDGWATN